VLDLRAVLADIEAHVSVDAHVLVGDPDQGETADKVAAPVGIQKSVVREQENENGHVMAEAVFAGKDEVKLAADEARMALTLLRTVIARFAEDLFMRDSPGDGRDGDGQHEQPDELQSKRHP